MTDNLKKENFLKKYTHLFKPSPDAKTAKLADSYGDNIPESIYNNLPFLLKESCNVFNDKYERDIFLTGVLGVLGGCFHNLYAYNEVDKKRVATNLLAIIVGPSASGKGALNYARMIAKEIKQLFAEYSKKFGKAKHLRPGRGAYSFRVALAHRACATAEFRRR